MTNSHPHILEVPSTAANSEFTLMVQGPNGGVINPNLHTCKKVGNPELIASGYAAYLRSGGKPTWEFHIYAKDAFKLIESRNLMADREVVISYMWFQYSTYQLFLMDQSMREHFLIEVNQLNLLIEESTFEFTPEELVEIDNIMSAINNRTIIEIPKPDVNLHPPHPFLPKSPPQKRNPHKS